MATLLVRVLPGASRNEVVAYDGQVLRVRLTAPPVEGKANAALVSFLAKMVGVRKSDIVLRRGQSGREKLLSVEGLTPDELRHRLETLASSDTR